MLFLSAGDVFILVEIAAARSLNQEQREEVKKILMRGFSEYGSEDLISSFGSRECLFRERADWLIENYAKGGQKSEEVFASEPGRSNLMRVMKGLGVADRFLDDLVDQVIAKFWRFQYAERYNPLKCPWGKYVKISVKRAVASLWAARERDPIEQGVAFQQCQNRSDREADSGSVEVWILDQDVDNPQCRAILNEFLSEFEIMLRDEKPFRPKQFRGYETICVLGSSSPRKIYYVKSQGKNNVRLVDPSSVNPDKDQGFLVEMRLLGNMEEVQSDGTKKIVQFKKNPNYDSNSIPERIERSPLDVYTLLMKGYQVEEISAELRVGPSTAHNWVRHLQQLFEEFWAWADFWIPVKLAWWARTNFKCPQCGRYQTEDGFCRECGQGFFECLGCKKVYPSEIVCNCVDPLTRESTSKVRRVTFSATEIERNHFYPWEVVRGTTDIKRRAGRYKPGIQVQRCGITGKVNVKDKRDFSLPHKGKEEPSKLPLVESTVTVVEVLEKVS